MRGRYLCCICCLLLLWFALLELVRGGTRDADPPPVPEGLQIRVSGTVYRREFSKTNQRIYLKDISFSLQSAGSWPKLKNWDNNRVIAYLKEPCGTPLGSRVQVLGICAYPSVQKNPGCFDARDYYGSMGVGMFVRRAEVLSVDGGRWPIRSAIADLRDFCRERLERAGEDTDAGILSAMLLGDKGMLDGEIKDLYQNAGLIHLLAISGLHISITGMALYRLLRRAGLPFGACGVLAGSAMAAYACMTGYPVSAVRAVLMFLIFLLSQAAGRTYDPPTSLAVSGAVILLGNSRAVGQAGFLLSFGAVCGVLLSGVWKSRPLRESSLGVSLGVQLATVPLTAYFYYQLPLYAVLINLCILWTVPFILASGIAGMAAAACSVSSGKFLLAPAHYLLRAIEFVCQKAQRLPFSSIIVGKPQFSGILAYYVVWAAFLYLCQMSEKKREHFGFFGKMIKIDLIKLLFASILLVGVLSGRGGDGLTATFLDVGQGDGCCIQNENRTVWMIDGGSSSESALADYTLEPFLKSRGIGRVDYWMISHYDKDHVSGLLEILRGYERGMDGGNAAGITVGTILLPGVREPSELGDELLSLARACKIPVRGLLQGDRIEDGDMEVRILAPAKDGVYENSNAASVVAQVSYGGFDALFTGDVEGGGELSLVQSGLLEDVDVLKVAHHGSRNSTGAEFLRQTKPELCVISCGEENSYGHPHGELLMRLADCNSRVARTDLQGAVEVRATKDGYTAESFLRADAQ